MILPSVPLIILNIALAVGTILLLLRFLRSVPDLIQAVLNDVGASITEQLNEVLTPTMKRGLSLASQKGNQAKANIALREKVASKITAQSPIVNKILEYFDVSPMEGIKILNDPMLAPIIQRFLAGLKEGKGTPFGGLSGPFNPHRSGKQMS